MGCDTSRLQEIGQITISIVDPNFGKSQNSKLKQKLAASNIRHQYYISVNCFIQEFMKRYINQIVAGIQNYAQVYQKLKKFNFTPNIYVIGQFVPSHPHPSIEENLGSNYNHKNDEINFNIPDNIIFIQDYNELIKILQDKNRKVRGIEDPQSKTNKKKKEQKIDVKILKKPHSVQSSQQLIFQSTLKAKGLTYEMYQNFHQLEHSMLQKDSHFIVTDYVYHKQVIVLVANTKTKVICSCSLDKDQTYDPQIYFISNNFLQISSQIASEISMKNMHSVHCGKIYFYTQGVNNPKDYADQIEEFNFEVRTFSDLDKMLKQTTFFFCVTVLAAESQIKNVQKYLNRNDYAFKVKVVALGKSVQPTVISMRKILKEFKKGYKAEKGLTTSIDIIDKHFDNVKFEEIKAELESSSIRCFGYCNLNNYTKAKKFISPFIICNFEERILLCRYLKQVQSSAKVIIFCNKTKINSQLKNDRSFAYVSSHFGKIISFIKKKEVYRPVIFGQSQIKINQKVEKLKNRNKRISALKWCGLEQPIQGGGGINMSSQNKLTQEDFQFVNVAKNANLNSIRDLQKDAAILWKLDYKPFSSFNNFKHDLTDSLAKLKRIYKINYPQHQFSALLSQIKQMDIGKLLSKVKQFFQSQNQLGLNINLTLIKIESLNKNDILCLRQFLFIANLNFISMYKTPRIGKFRLQHWTSQPFIEKCEVGSYLLTKNFYVFYQDNSLNSDTLSSYKITTEITYDTLVEADLNINSFFKYKDKYIFSPYSQFIVKSMNTDQSGIINVELQYIKNVQYLKYFYTENLLKDNQSFIDIFKKAIQSSNQQNQKKVSPMIDFRILSSVRLNYQRMLSLKAHRQGNHDIAIECHKKIIKEEEQLQNLDSVKINELNYELGFFYLKNKQIQQAGNLIKQLINAKPCGYILDKCKQIINSVVSDFQQESAKKIQQQVNPTIKKIPQQNSTFSKRQIKNNQQKKNEEKQSVIRTFVWLKQNQGDMEDLNDSAISCNSIKQKLSENKQKKRDDNQKSTVLRQLKNTEKQIPCLNIDDENYQLEDKSSVKSNQKTSKSKIEEFKNQIIIQQQFNYTYGSEDKENTYNQYS